MKIFKKLFTLLAVFLLIFSFAKNIFAAVSDGTEDINFYNNLGSGFNGKVKVIKVQPDGKILVGGEFTSFNGNTRKGIVRLLENGTEDTAFYNNLGSGFNSTVFDIAIQPDGKILVGGEFEQFKGITRNHLVRLNSNGTEDTAFYNNLGSGFFSTVFAIEVQSDNKIIALGNFSSLNGNSRKGIVRLLENGTEDIVFYNNFVSKVDNLLFKNLTIQPDGKIIIVGSSGMSISGGFRNCIFRLNSSGLEDTAFYQNIGSGCPNDSSSASGQPYFVANQSFHSVKVQPDGKILAGGSFTDFNGNKIFSLIRFNIDGTLDYSFSPNTNNNYYNIFTPLVYDIDLQSNNEILVGGSFDDSYGSFYKYLVRLSQSGNQSLLFNGFDNSILDIAIQPDGKILVGGEFTSFNGNTRNYLTRFTCCNVPPTVTLSATPSNVATGGATNLTWTVENATSCTASGGWTGSKSINGGSQIIGNLQSDTVFNLSCSGPGGTTVSNTNVTVSAALPVVNLSALPLAIPQGGTTKLTWSSTNATSCTASAIPSNSAWTGPKNPAGSFKNITNLQIDTTFKLSCTGGGGTSEASVSVTVAPKPTINFNADPTTVNYNGNTTLTWTVTNATSCTASGGWTGSKNAVSGSEVKSNLVSNTTFTLSCSGPGGTNQASAIVTVNSPNPTITLTASPTNVNYGEYTSLTWSSTNATSCTASGGWTGTKSSSGSQPILTPLTTDTTFNLACSGLGGNANASVIVTVNPQAPTVTLTLDPISISIPGSANLTWTSNNATSCTASSTPNTTWTGVRVLNSTEPEKVLNITSDTEFVLSCSGPGGTTEKKVTLTTVALPTVSLSINKTEILPGQSVTLSWNVTNATSCIATSSPNNADWNGNQAFANGVHTKVINNIQNDTSFNIVCNNQAGTDNDSVSIKLIAEKLTFNNTKVLYDANSKQYKTKLSWVAINVKDCVASTNSEDGEVKNSWAGNKLSSPSPYQGETQNVIVKSVLPEVTKYTLTCNGIHSNKVITLSKDLHTASLASSGVGIPNYEEN
jgi:uncharacterized delta-60 repeat protein